MSTRAAVERRPRPARGHPARRDPGPEPAGSRGLARRARRLSRGEVPPAVAAPLSRGGGRHPRCPTLVRVLRRPPTGLAPGRAQDRQGPRPRVAIPAGRRGPAGRGLPRSATTSPRPVRAGSSRSPGGERLGRNGLRLGRRGHAAPASDDSPHRRGPGIPVRRGHDIPSPSVRVQARPPPPRGARTPNRRSRGGVGGGKGVAARRTARAEPGVGHRRAPGVARRSGRPALRPGLVPRALPGREDVRYEPAGPLPPLRRDGGARSESPVRLWLLPAAGSGPRDRESEPVDPLPRERCGGGPGPQPSLRHGLVPATLSRRREVRCQPAPPLPEERRGGGSGPEPPFRRPLVPEPLSATSRRHGQTPWLTSFSSERPRAGTPIPSS